MKKYIISSVVFIIAIISISSSTSRVLAATAKENMLIVFDASGSMTEQLGSASRIETAKSTISDLLGSLDSNTLVGLRALAQEKKSTKADACIVTALLQPFTSDHTAVLNQVNALQAVGAYTPLAYTLQQAAGDFTVGQNNVLILMTDGQENCGGNPSQAATALKNAGINVKTYVIGLGASAAMRADLSAIAVAGGGTYYDATDAASLAASFNAIQEKEHPIDKTNTDSSLGTEVTGGNGYETAVPITPGLYHLSHNQFGGEYDYFKMDVTAGDQIDFSIQSSDSRINYDPKTNTYIDTHDHNGDCAGISIYSPTRAKLSYVSEDYSSTLNKNSYTVDESGTLYFLIGGGSGCVHDYLMAKTSLFTIKVSGQTPPAAPAVPSSTNTSSQPVSTNTTGSTDNQNSNQNVQPTSSAPATTSSNVMLMVGIGAVIVLLLIILAIVLLKKKTTPVAPPSFVRPPAPSVPPVMPTNIPVPPTPPVPPVAPFQ